MSKLLDKFLAEYDRQTVKIDAVDADPNAPVDGACGMRASLRRFVDSERDGLIIELARVVAKIDNTLS